MTRSHRSVLIAVAALCCGAGGATAQVIRTPAEESRYGLIRYSMYGLTPEKGDVFAALRVTKPQDLAVIPYRSWRD